MDSDEQLLASWRAGDRRAGNLLVRRHHASVARFFENAVNDQERYDLTQDTFRRLTQSLAGFRGDASVRTYIFTIARHVLLDHLRKRYREDLDPLTHTVEDLEGATPSRVIGELQRTRRLLVCLRALPVDTKQALELYYWQGLTAAELGAIFEAPEGTIRRRIHDAKRSLARCLITDPGGAEASTDAPAPDDDTIDQQLAALGDLLASGPSRV